MENTASSLTPTDTPLTLDQLPSPSGLPLLGNLFQLKSNSLHQQLENWAHELGPLYVLRMGGKKVLVSAHPELNQLALKMRPGSFSRLSRLEPLSRAMNLLGVFSAEGADWKRQRYVVMQALANKNLRQFFPVIQQVTHRLLNRWALIAQQGATLPVQEDLMRFTVDVTSHLAFGYPMNTLEQEGDIIQEHLETIFPTLQRRLFIPIDYWKYVKLPADRAMDRAMKEILKAIQTFIREAQVQLESQPALQENPANFLQALLVARDEAGNPFSQEEIIANVFTMLLAGEDTTAYTIAWMMHFLAQHPNIQQQLQQEVDHHLGESPIISQMETMGKLELLEAITQETLRLKPVAPVIFQTAVEEVTLVNLTIPKGTDVFVLTRIPVLDPELFVQKTKFDAHFWLQTDSALKRQINQRYAPFGSGPRFCPGRNLAQMEIKLAVAMIAHQFQLSIPENSSSEVKEKLSFAMGPENLYIQLKLRER